MADDDLQDFFEENTQWVGQNGEVEDPHTPPPPPHSRKEMRNRRLRRRRAYIVRIVAAIVAVVIVAAVAVVAVKAVRGLGSFQVSRSVVEDYSGPGEGSVSFTVESGQSPAQIGDDLVKQGVVKSSAAFQQALTGSGKESLIQPGTFELKRRMSAADVVEILTDSTKAGGFLVVNPGERFSDIIDQAAQLSGLDESDFTAIVDAKGDGILPAEANGSFEGWIEPGSYNVKGMGSAEEILKEMVDKRIDKLDELGVPTGSDRERVLIIASIVEGEVNKSDYYGKVSRVVENRLACNMPLGMDSTVAYGAGVAPGALTNAMLNDTSNAYNTRIHTGLPPTPINQPGDSAIKAAMSPEDGDWLYFVTVNLDTGETKFTDNESEFNQYVQEYRAWQEANAG